MEAFYSKARIPLPDGDELSVEQRAVFETMRSGPRGTVQGPIRAAIHSPVLAERWQRLGAFLRYDTSLSPRHSELAILTTARSWDSQLEWVLHVPHALSAGIGEDIIESLRLGSAPQLADEVDRIVFAFSAQLLETHTVNDEVYSRAEELLEVIGTVELTALVGYYSMVAMTLNAHHIPPPEGVAMPPGLIELSKDWSWF